MAILGIRCTNKQFAYAILDGAKTGPTVLEAKIINCPASTKRPSCIFWIFTETQSLIDKYGIELIVIKKNEGRTYSGSIEERIEHEAAVILAGHSKGIKGIFKKGIRTILVDLDLKGKHSELEKLDTSSIPNYDKSTQHLKDAYLSAWSELN